MSATSIEEVRKSVRSYMMVFGALMVLTVVTVAVSKFHFAVPIAITLALVIASVKGALVASVFMHLSHERKIIYASLLLTVFFFVFLMFIPLFGMKDQVHLKETSLPHAPAPAHAPEHAPEH